MGRNVGVLCVRAREILPVWSFCPLSEIVHPPKESLWTFLLCSRIRLLFIPRLMANNKPSLDQFLLT